MRYSILIILIVFLSIGFVKKTNAQFNVVETAIEVNLIPENPKPNEIVQASAVSYATNLNAAKITWTVNGKVQKSGMGEKVISFTVGDAGSKTLIGIKIETAEGEVINKSFSINPASVDLVWQSSGYVPPFYKGKSLYSHQNEITVVAIPHLVSSKSEISPKNLIYTWKKDDKVIEGASGFGMNTFTFQGSLISRPVKVEVTASSQDDSVSAYYHITINPQEPKLLVYKRDPLYGIEFQKSITGAMNIDNIEELSVVAVPYFFGVTSPKSTDLTYRWSINGADTNNSPDSTTQVFRKKAGVSGRSNIGVTLESSDKILQYASNNFSIVFSGKTTTPSI